MPKRIMIQNQTKPTRFLSALFISRFTDFVVHAVHKYEMSLEEVLIICLVAARSTSSIIEDKGSKIRYGFEYNALPDQHRSPVTLKYIYISLGINRETARRKINNLVNRNLLIKTKKGFIFPEQKNENDYTRDIRLKLSSYIEEIHAESEMPSS